MAVRLFEHIDFAGRSEVLREGVYRADQLAAELVSSAQVPFGWTVELFEHEDGGHGGGQKLVLPFGDHKLVGGSFSDKAALVKVLPWTELVLCTDDPGPPPALRYQVAFTDVVGGGRHTVAVAFDSESDTRYYQQLSHRLAPGAQPRVWESAQRGNAGWSHTVDGDLLVVRLWVTPRRTFDARSWVAVRVSPG